MSVEHARIAARLESVTEAMRDLHYANWLDPDPCDTPELADAKQRALICLGEVSDKPSKIDHLKTLLERWLSIDDFGDESVAPADLVADTREVITKLSVP
ncbi:hypothetical protein [Pseudomonas marincola]|jgi:hypothetical protein|uniref:hypothetical protein n=1 Tax=Pseudomonas marincola TaxID=437900 RepID=UPI0008E57A4B|nr:hypothetical protein [Pseudomonas marincola]SFU19425.1 hypothetical protein SAMN05216264_12147 [Pseudomonas marincola]